MPSPDRGVEALLCLSFVFDVLCVVVGYWFGVSGLVQGARRSRTRGFCAFMDRNEWLLVFFLVAGLQSIASLANFSGFDLKAAGALTFQLGFWATGMGLLAARQGGASGGIGRARRWAFPVGVSNTPGRVWSAAGFMALFGAMLFVHTFVSRPGSLLGPWIGQNSAVIAFALLMGLRTRLGWLTAVMWPVALAGLYCMGLEYGWWA